MAKHTITNKSRALQGVRPTPTSAPIYIRPGETRENVELDEAGTKQARRLEKAGIFGFGTAAAKDNGGVQPTDWAQVTAVHQGGGSYSVKNGKNELVEKLTKDEAEAFNALDAGTKQAWVEERTAR